MGKINSKRKGKVGELELAKYLTARGYKSRRGVQYKGGEDSPDVVSTLPCHIECKRVERLDLYKALEQARNDSGAISVGPPLEGDSEAVEGTGGAKTPPVVMHRSVSLNVSEILRQYLEEKMSQIEKELLTKDEV